MLACWCPLSLMARSLLPILFGTVWPDRGCPCCTDNWHGPALFTAHRPVRCPGTHHSCGDPGRHDRHHRWLLYGARIYRRFKRLSFAVDQWGQGNFTVLAKDLSGDELGQLTHRLNRMAEQFQALLHAYQQVGMLEERNILSKLHLLDRTQAAVLAWQQGLVKGKPDSGQW